MNKSASLSILQRGAQGSCHGFYCPLVHSSYHKTCVPLPPDFLLCTRISSGKLLPCAGRAQAPPQLPWGRDPRPAPSVPVSLPAPLPALPAEARHRPGLEEQWLLDSKARGVPFFFLKNAWHAPSGCLINTTHSNGW